MMVRLPPVCCDLRAKDVGCPSWTAGHHMLDSTASTIRVGFCSANVAIQTPSENRLWAVGASRNKPKYLALSTCTAS